MAAKIPRRILALARAGLAAARPPIPRRLLCKTLLCSICGRKATEHVAVCRCGRPCYEHHTRFSDRAGCAEYVRAGYVCRVVLRRWEETR